MPIKHNAAKLLLMALQPNGFILINKILLKFVMYRNIIRLVKMTF